MPKRTLFDPELLQAMCSLAKIPSKEPGLDEKGEPSFSTMIPFDPFLPTQAYLCQEIVSGLAQGKHTFFVLKCRQSGITTLGCFIMLYLCFSHAGAQTTFIADNSKRLFYNRKLAKKAFQSLAAYPDWRQEEDDNNREVLSFKNDSAIWWNNANSDDEGGLGRSMGVPFAWLTELGLYRDEEGIGSFMSSLPENNPMSLIVCEGTAMGPNLFYELFQTGAEPTNTTQKSIFIGWWIHPWYEHNLRVPEHRKRYENYWLTLPRLTKDEARWVEGVRERYGFEIRPTQLSWWRQHLHERKNDNLMLMYQEYPPLEEDAWAYGGTGLIDGRKLSKLTTQAIKERQLPKRYFVFDPGDGVRFESSDIVEVDPAANYYDLVCYAEPVVGPMVRYAIGCDPAHGANEESDHTAAEVLLCYSDKAIQVAEFVKRQIPTNQIAWVILHLVGAYNSGEAETHLNIEMQGGGTEVYAEIKRLQNEMAYGYTPKLARYFQRISHYIYYRPDSATSRGATVHWETTGKTKIRMLHNYKSLIEQDRLVLKSEELIKESARLVQLRDGSMETGREDHRLMAMAIAGMAYIQLCEMDIGGRREYSSTELEIVHTQDPAILTPGQVLQSSIKAWRDNMLAQEAEEADTLPNRPEWQLAIETDYERDNWQ